MGAVAHGPSDLHFAPWTVYSVQVAPDRATVVVCDGVCLFFENSTVCRMLVPCLFWPRLPGWSFVSGWVGVSLSGFWCFASDQSGASALCVVGGGVVFCWSFNGEFDPGSGRTLAACLTHASRAVRPFGVHERRTGE